MSSIPAEISDAFLERLKINSEFDQEVLKILGTKFAEGKPLKAEDYIAVFTLPKGGEVK